MLWAWAALCAGPQGSEEIDPLDKAPKAVVDAVKKRFKEAELKGASKEMEKDKLVYEITIKHKGQNIDVTVTPEGEIIMLEKEIAAKQLPKPVSKVLGEKFAQAKYKIIEEIIQVDKKKEKLLYYEVLLELPDKKRLEVKIAADGKITKEEDEDAEKEKEEHGKSAP
jgi:uncharacterized membrane protein YkoI